MWNKELSAESLGEIQRAPKTYGSYLSYWGTHCFEKYCNLTFTSSLEVLGNRDETCTFLITGKTSLLTLVWILAQVNGKKLFVNKFFHLGQSIEHVSISRHEIEPETNMDVVHLVYGILSHLLFITLIKHWRWKSVGHLKYEYCMI